MKRLFPVFFVLLALASPPAHAQSTAPAQGAAAAPADTAGKKARKPRAERSPQSVACSAEADQKGLKGAERKKFRRACMTAARKKA